MWRDRNRLTMEVHIYIAFKGSESDADRVLGNYWDEGLVEFMVEGGSGEIVLQTVWESEDDWNEVEFDVIDDLDRKGQVVDYGYDY